MNILGAIEIYIVVVCILGGLLPWLQYSFSELNVFLLELTVVLEVLEQLHH